MPIVHATALIQMIFSSFSQHIFFPLFSFSPVFRDIFVIVCGMDTVSVNMLRIAFMMVFLFLILSFSTCLVAVVSFSENFSFMVMCSPFTTLQLPYLFPTPFV